jgi:hypothetical protein
MEPTAELSCYTANLTEYLSAFFPDTVSRLAGAVRLTVRTDLAGGLIAFRHHERIDQGADGTELSYRSASSWPAARGALLVELGRNGAVLAVANARHVPWSPQYGRKDTPHWILVRGHEGGSPEGGRWAVADRFAAMLPEGPQQPHAGWLGDEQLARALMPSMRPAPEAALRDVCALGGWTPPPAAPGACWLTRTQQGPPTSPPGHWLTEPGEVVGFLADRLSARPDLLRRHADDLWAAARHQCFRLAVLAEAGAIDSAAAAAAAASWTRLPRSARFAVESAARGRPRPGALGSAFDDVAALGLIEPRPIAA